MSVKLWSASYLTPIGAAARLRRPGPISTPVASTTAAASLCLRALSGGGAEAIDSGCGSGAVRRKITPYNRELGCGQLACTSYAPLVEFVSLINWWEECHALP
jgi:hypothetical protein